MSRRRRRIIALIALAPALIAIGAWAIGGWRYRAGLEAGAYLFLAAGSLFAVAALARGSVPGDRRTMSLLVWKVDMVRHRLVFAVIFGAAGALTLWLGANDVGDWLVPPETRSVVVDRTFESIRTGVTTIYTDVGKFQSPLFLSFHVEAGPATLTLGHFSGHVLAVDQDP